MKEEVGRITAGMGGRMSRWCRNMDEELARFAPAAPDRTDEDGG